MKHVKSFNLFESRGMFSGTEIEDLLNKLDIEYHYNDRTDDFVCVKDRIRITIATTNDEDYEIQYSFGVWNGQVKAKGIEELEKSLNKIIASKPSKQEEEDLDWEGKKDKINKDLDRERWENHPSNPYRKKRY